MEEIGCDDDFDVLQETEAQGRFLDLLPEGDGLTPALHRFLYWLLTTDDPAVSMGTWAEVDEAAREWATALHRRALAGNPPAGWEWEAAVGVSWLASREVADVAEGFADEVAAARLDRERGPGRWEHEDPAWRAAFDGAWDRMAAKLREILAEEGSTIMSESDHEPIPSPLPAARQAGAVADAPSLDAARAIDLDRGGAVEVQVREAEELLSALLLDAAALRSYLAHCRRPDLHAGAPPVTILASLDHIRDLAASLAGPVAALGELTR